MRTAKPPLPDEQAQDTVDETATNSEQATFPTCRACVGARIVVVVRHSGIDCRPRDSVVHREVIPMNRIAHANLPRGMPARFKPPCYKDGFRLR
jgi:hypothetical protein